MTLTNEWGELPPNLIIVAIIAIFVIFLCMTF